MISNPSPLFLRRLEPQDEQAFITAVGQWDNNSGFLFTRDYNSTKLFLDFIDDLRSNERGENLPPGFVPDTSLFAFIENKIIGRISIRHSLTPFLLQLGGHIGYGVIPSERQKGYAKEMLRLSLPIAKELGLQKALVTCNDNNIGSYKAIEANGGQLENTVFVAEGEPLKRRYWIDLTTLSQK